MKNRSAFSISVQALIERLLHPVVPGLICTAGMTWVALQIDPDRLKPPGSDRNAIVEIFELIHLKSIDLRFRNRGERDPHPRVAVLAVDDESIDRVGRWPWPRTKIAQLIDNAILGGASVVGFDAIFSEPDPNSASRLLHEALIRIKSKDQKLSESLEADLRGEIAKANADQVLAQTIQRHSESVVAGSYFEASAQQASTSEKNRLCRETTLNLLSLSRYWKKEKIQITSIEPASPIPDGLKSQYQERVQPFLMEQETAHFAEFIQNNPETTSRLTNLLAELEIQLPAEILPFFLTAGVLEDQDLLSQLLDSQDDWKQFNNPSSRANIILTILKSLEMKDLSELREQLRSRFESYCAITLSSEDPLLSEKKLQETLGLEDEAVLKELWTERNLVAINAQIESHLSPSELTSHPLQIYDPITEVDRTALNIPTLAKETQHTGFFNAALDPDGVVRRTYLVAKKGNLFIPSLALKMFLVDQRRTAQIKRSLLTQTNWSSPLFAVESFMVRGSTEASQEDPTLNLGANATVTASSRPKRQHQPQDLALPVDHAGRLLINYAGPQKKFPYLRASSLLESVGPLEVVQRVSTDGRNVIEKVEKIDRAEFLKNKLLIFGVTAMAVYDLRQTPYDENFPGVETHANTLSNLMLMQSSPDQGPLRQFAEENQYLPVAVAVLGVLFSIALAIMSSLGGFIFSVVSLLGLSFAEFSLLFQRGIVINISLVLLSLFSIFVTITFFKYFTEERNKRELKGTFAKYVSPAVVDEILKDPKNIELGGKKTDLTVLFSDVRGFTTISEKLDPRALSDLLNSYLTPMTEIVFSTQGTLDKYMGDAIMAFWGAPIHFDRHPDQACFAALKMLNQLSVLQQQYREKGLPEIDIGIGINTGEMSVGNMGSNTVRSYTVMGDAVNLGSRLEGINKEYGTRIVISEFTQSRISRDFITREIDWVRVKGKAQPVRIFELCGHRTQSEFLVAPDLLSLIPHFETAFQAYHARDFELATEALKKCLELRPDDPVSLLYVERIKSLRSDPPASDWDGVFVMKTK